MLSNQSSLLEFVVRYGILSGQIDSVVGRNVLICSLRYNKTNVDYISKLEFGPHKSDRYAVTFQVDLNTSALLLDLLTVH